jgi:putative OPT family oligopeptide transporter
VTVVRAMPTMVKAFMAGAAGLFKPRGADEGLRTERDLPMGFVLLGVIGVILATTFVPMILGDLLTLPMRILSGVCIALFSFLFVTVSSRIVGLVGVTSNPTSGMTLVTLLGSTLVFYALGWRDLTGRVAALTVGTMVCVAASKAGDISQDLKAGFLVGATPWRQQIGQLIGAATSAFFVASAVYILGQTYTFGSADIPAPQATLMKTVIEGVLSANLPWGLILAGATLAAIAEFVVRVPALPFAVGLYLPLSTMTPVFLGGLTRQWLEKRYPAGEQTREAQESDPARLLGAGFIAGEGLIGVLIAILAFLSGAKPKGIGLDLGPVVSLLVFTSLIVLLARTFRSARRG